MASENRTAVEVARRCICLELMHQRFVLEQSGDEEDPVAEREKARQLWCGRLTDLGVDDVLLAEEKALLDKEVGTLDEDALDDVHGRATGALVLLWALGRLEVRPSFETVNQMEAVLADHGLLGDGSISKCKEAAQAATLRTDNERENARHSYVRTRGKAKEVEEGDRIFAEVAAHHLQWVGDDQMSFDSDPAL
jgi:hypothetical protein